MKSHCLTLLFLLLACWGCNDAGRYQKQPAQAPKIYGSDIKLSDGPTLSDVYDATKDSPRLVDTPGGGQKIVFGNK